MRLGLCLAKALDEAIAELSRRGEDVQTDGRVGDTQEGRELEAIDTARRAAIGIHIEVCILHAAADAAEGEDGLDGPWAYQIN